MVPLLFTLYIADFSINSPQCNLQKLSDDSGIVGVFTEQDDSEYRQWILDFVEWCQQTEPSPDQHWEYQRDGGGLPQKQTHHTDSGSTVTAVYKMSKHKCSLQMNRERNFLHTILKSKYLYLSPLGDISSGQRGLHHTSQIYLSIQSQKLNKDIY